MVTLESSKLFSHLPAKELNLLKGDIQEKKFAKGQEIFKEGDAGDGVFVVQSGLVEITAVMSSGQREVLSRVPAGDVFGEMSLLDQHPRSACAVAAEDTVVYFVPREPMVQMLRQSPEVSLKLTQEISARLREFNHHYVDKVLQAERMALVGRFASSIVHDLKNPLTIIGMATRSACREDSTVETRQTAETRINKQIERITSLVNDILEFTRGSTSAPTFYQADFAEFIQHMVEELTPEVEPKRVRIELENDPPAVSLQLNPKRLSRVLYNLIDNAVDAMPMGGVVTLRFQDAGKEIITEIEDCGKGIEPDHLSEIFDAFATFGKARGTGLGLSIALRVIEEHKGRITARNSDKGGAVFAFSLPKSA